MFTPTRIKSLLAALLLPLSLFGQGYPISGGGGGSLPAMGGQTGKYLSNDGTSALWAAGTAVPDGNKGDITVSSSGATWNINTNAVGSTQLASTAVAPGSYTNSNITVDVDGRITAAANGTSGGSATWGAITGTLPAQTDLQTALNAKLSLTGDGSGLINLSGAQLATGTVGPTQLAATAVTAGPYTNANITVDADGRITLAANGSGGGSGTVTSVGATSGSAALGITGSPITTSGSFAFSLDADLTQFAALADPGEHRLVVWNDTTNQYAFSVIGSGLSFDGTTLSATAGGGGTVTATAGALTNNAIMLGAGTVDSKVLGSLGTTTTVLHGNAAGAPTFGAVSLTADVSGILPDANIPSAITRDAEAAAAYQPLNANLTLYAGITPTTAGLALLDDADAAAQQATLFSTTKLSRGNGGTGGDTSAFGNGLLGSNVSNQTINVNTASLLSTAIGGETTGSGNVVRSSGATLNDTRKTVQAIGPFTGTMALDFTSGGSWKTGTATGNVTFSGITLSAGSIGVLSFTQDATGGRVPTWPASVVDPEPQIELAPNATTLLTFSSPDGTNIFVTGSMPNVLALDSLTVDALTATTLDGPADDLTLTATGFNGNLATTDDTVQEVAQKVDDLVVSGGSGDITSVGDVASGAAFDGTQGTILTFNDADGDLTLGTNATANTMVFSHPIDLGATGVRLTGDGDGAVTFASISAGNQENVTINLDDTANEIVMSSSTGVLYFRYSSLNLIAASYAGDVADSADAGVVRASNNQVGIAWEASPTGVDTTLLVDASEIFQFSSGINVTGAGAFSTGVTIGGVAVSSISGTATLTNKDLSDDTNTLPKEYIVPCSDLTTAVTTSGTKAFWPMPYAATLVGIKADVLAAPTGANLIIDVLEGGTSVMTTNKLVIEATETSTGSATTQPTITDASIANGARMTATFTQVGSTFGGAGVVITCYFKY